MRKKQSHWLSYWNATTDLDYLLYAQDNIDKVYTEIRGTLGRSLMSEEMLELQESLDERIDQLKKIAA
jgi:hypothetical protein